MPYSADGAAPHDQQDGGGEQRVGEVAGGGPGLLDEGAPLIVCPNAVLKAAPNPNAARLFQSYLFSAEGQQLLCDYAAQHSAHPQVKPKPGRPALKDIKVMKDDPVAVEAQAEQIKTKYLSYFKV